MLDFEILRLIPRFIAEDRNGYALAMAMQAGAQRMNDIIGESLAALSDPEQMPEWRLDEIAWEFNFPYDTRADIEVKRRWIADVFDLSRLLGTGAGIEAYLKGRFDGAQVEEAASYGGEPFHFRVNLSGEWDPTNIRWGIIAAGAFKNLRSVLDGMRLATPAVGGRLPVYAGAALYMARETSFPATEQPDITADFLTDEGADFLTDEAGLLTE